MPGAVSQPLGTGRSWHIHMAGSWWLLGRSLVSSGTVLALVLILGTSNVIGWVPGCSGFSSRSPCWCPCLAASLRTFMFCCSFCTRGLRRGSGMMSVAPRRNQAALIRPARRARRVHRMTLPRCQKPRHPRGVLCVCEQHALCGCCQIAMAKSTTCQNGSSSAAKTVVLA